MLTLLRPKGGGGGGGGGEAARFVGSVAKSGTTSCVTTMPVALPSNVNAGELLFGLLHYTSNSSRDFEDAPEGWQHASFNLNLGDHHVFLWRVADGSEEATVTVQLTSGCVRWTAIATRIEGAHGDVEVEFGPRIIAGTKSPNPPELTFPWVGPTLVVATVGTRDLRSFSAAPADYVDLEQHSNSVTGSNLSSSVAWAHRAVDQASEDPGAFTMTENTVDPSVAVTVGIRSASG